MTFGPVDTIFAAAGLLCLLGGIYAALNLRGAHLAEARAGEGADAQMPDPAMAGGE
jgi:hypothetical protein